MNFVYKKGMATFKDKSANTQPIFIKYGSLFPWEHFIQGTLVDWTTASGSKMWSIQPSFIAVFHILAKYKPK